MKSVLLAFPSFACALTGAAQNPPAQFASRTALIIGIPYWLMGAIFNRRRQACSKFGTPQ